MPRLSKLQAAPFIEVHGKIGHRAGIVQILDQCHAQMPDGFEGTRRKTIQCMKHRSPIFFLKRVCFEFREKCNTVEIDIPKVLSRNLSAVQLALTRDFCLRLAFA